MKQRFIKAMDDDLNISAALAAIFSFINEINPVLWQKGLNKTDKGKILSTFKELDQVLNIMDIDEVKLDEETLRLIKEREAARKRKDWARADALRQKLLSQGIEIIDTNQGPIWRIVQKKQS